MRVVLRVVIGEGGGAELVFPPGQYLFGRAEGCHVHLPMRPVSRRHCLLRVTDQGATIRDLGSRNGTVVNSKRITEEQPLRHGDRLFLSGTTYVVQIDGGAVDTGANQVVLEARPVDATIDFPEDRSEAMTEFDLEMRYPPLRPGRP